MVYTLRCYEQRTVHRDLAVLSAMVVNYVKHLYIGFVSTFSDFFFDTTTDGSGLFTVTTRISTLQY